MQKIVPCLWFDNQGEEAARFYVSVFRNAKMGAIARYGEGAPLPAGTALTVAFELDGVAFTALNGGPMFKFSEAVSMQVMCEDQAEIDYYWDKLIEGGGAPSMCGWLKDRYGFSWQVVPRMIGKLFTQADPAAAQRAMGALMQMTKLDIATLDAALAG